MGEHVRQHVVLVPGFVGFDALGQLHYYAGVTSRFGTWRKQQAEGRDVAVHCFDNFPTASVELRAGRLMRYLANKIQRGEIGERDQITLVGHSTGGLDIRRALAFAAGESSEVYNGSAQERAEILERCRKVVFLSVPHFGTKLADFSCAFIWAIQMMVRNAGLGLRWNRDYIAAALSMIPQSVVGTESQPLLALFDVLHECDERAAEDTQRTAEREARAMLGLWLDHMGHDFHVLSDLRTRAESDEQTTSPALMGPAERRAEVARYREQGLQIRSYVTRVPGSAAADTWVRSALRSLELVAAVGNRWSRVKRASGRWIAPALPVQSLFGRTVVASAPLVPAVLALHRRPAILFEMFHAICQSDKDPFVRPSALLPEVRTLVADDVIRAADIAVGESDGVVNTLSMLWPYDDQHPDMHRAFLVECDHGDIIGHYKLRAMDRVNGGRRYQAYDIFPSGCSFNDVLFFRIWDEVFDFAVS